MALDRKQVFAEANRLRPKYTAYTVDDYKKWRKNNKNKKNTVEYAAMEVLQRQKFNQRFKSFKRPPVFFTTGESGPKKTNPVSPAKNKLESKWRKSHKEGLVSVISYRRRPARRRK